MTYRTLCLKMLAALADLGNSPCARFDARECWAIYQRELAELDEREGVNAKDDALRECVKYLDVYPDNIFWPRPELIAKCKQALEK